MLAGVRLHQHQENYLVTFNLTEMFGLVENRLFAYADNSTPPAVVSEPVDMRSVVASVNRDRVWIMNVAKVLFLGA